MRNSIFAAALAVAVAIPGGLAAQNTADVTATAEVLVPITVTNAADLDFGDVLRGVPSTVVPAAGGAFAVAGSDGRDVILDFVVPTELTSATLATLPVAFTGGFGDGAPDNAIADLGASTPATLNGAGGLDVFIGGTVSPGAAQEAGVYTGTVTLTVSYAGS